MINKLLRFVASTPPPPRPPLRPPAAPRFARTRSSTTPKPSLNGKTPSIIGRWQEPNTKDETEFRSDGTLIERGANGDVIEGRYSLKGDKLSVRLNGSPEELSFAISLKHNTLEMTYADGQVTRYTRA